MGLPDQIGWDVEEGASFEQCRMEVLAMQNMPVQILFFARGEFGAPKFRTQGVLCVPGAQRDDEDETLQLGLDRDSFTRLEVARADFVSATVAPGHVEMLYETVVVTVDRASLLFHMRKEAERASKASA